MSEAGAGSDVVGMKLRAEKRNDRYVLNGTKYWITNGPDADTLVVYAKTDPDAGSKGITAFPDRERDGRVFDLAPFRQAGDARVEHGGADLRGCGGALRERAGRRGARGRRPDVGLDYERVVLSGVNIGIMAGCLDEVMPYMVERKQFGQPIGSFQLMQGKIADMYTAMNSARAYAYEVAKACDRGEVTRQDAAACVLYASEEGMKVAHQAVQAMGGAGFLNDSP
jgi:isovaleryl-CoA dehydrogenase